MERQQLRNDLECIVQKREVAEGESMVDILKRLDAVAKEPSLPKKLEHYLSKRSYLKALEWLDHPETPHYQ
ncbi:MAG: hypothetical protein ACSHX4_06830 [Opitutaceae bacterium]